MSDKQNDAKMCNLGVLFSQGLGMCKKQKWLKTRVKTSSGKHFVTVKTVREVKKTLAIECKNAHKLKFCTKP